MAKAELAAKAEKAARVEPAVLEAEVALAAAPRAVVFI